ncbi:MAG: MBL fold metallo-hydrolase [Ignavibacteriales bacterium]|nr:MBL fold metallo-hydrolase [Ignavibacteriales bacterium]
MKARFWGTRGSIATPGPATMKYGGNTPCMEVRAGCDIFVFDAGTGLRGLGIELLNEFTSQPITIHLFISHTHWDHIQGFPFFIPAYQKQHRILVYGPPGRARSLEQIFRTQLDSDYHPIALNDMGSNIVIQEIREPMRVGNVSIDFMYLNHPAMCLGYKISHEGSSIVYATDNEPYEFTLPQIDSQTGPVGFPRFLDEKLNQFIDGADLYIGDAQFTSEEYQYKKGWGHTPLDFCVNTAVAAHVGKLALFHHDPFHDDAFIDGMVTSANAQITALGSSVECFGAAEGMEVTV